MYIYTVYTHISISHVHVCACTLHTQGEGSQGQLGQGSTQWRLLPVRVQGPLAERKVIQVSCGTSHTAALAEKGQLFTWGSGDNGQLGHGEIEGTDSSVPMLVRSLAQARVTSVSCGAFFTGACCDDGALWMWGNGAFGQLGTGSKGSSVMPVRVDTLHRQCWVTSVSCGTWHAAALGQEARVPGSSLWVWGDNAHGQLGTGCRRSILQPERLAFGQQRCGTATVVRVGCFATHTACVACEGASLLQDGRVFTWGNNSSGQLGLGHTCSSLEPTEVADFRAMLLSSGPGASHTLAANRKGLLFAWGSCGFGQLGSGQRDNLLVPTPVLGLYENAKEEGEKFAEGSTNVRPHWWRSAAVEDLEKIVHLRMARSRPASETQEADSDKVQGARVGS